MKKKKILENLKTFFSFFRCFFSFSFLFIEEFFLSSIFFFNVCGGRDVWKKMKFFFVLCFVACLNLIFSNNKQKNVKESCLIKNKTIERIKNQLELQFQLPISTQTIIKTITGSSNFLLNSLNVTMLFGHLHHAGGTAVCQLARQNIPTNLKSNCNHPNEFSNVITPPTRGTIKEQLLFQQRTNWRFYSVELLMPKELLYEGPFLYSIILRHPYILLLSQYRRLQIKFNFHGGIIDLIKHQFLRVNSTFIPSRALKSNYYRGIGGFILGKFQETSRTNQEILNEVIERLERFSIILLTEEMSITGQLFHLKFNWNTSQYGENLINSHGNLSNLIQLAKNLTIEDKRFIKWYCSIDILIYRYGRCLINEELKKYLNKERISNYNRPRKVQLLGEYSKELIEMESIFNVNE